MWVSLKTCKEQYPARLPRNVKGGPPLFKPKGEKQAAQKLADAASILANEPGGLFVRLLRTIPEIAGQRGILLPSPPLELRYLAENPFISKMLGREGMMKEGTREATGR